MRAPWHLMAVLMLLPWLALGAAGQTPPDPDDDKAQPPANGPNATDGPGKNTEPSGHGPGETAKPPADPADTRESMCLMIESAARSNGLPLEFFARVIWQESRFQADAVGPRTRSGARALGIAQFMPGTAAERRLLDPFDPVQALPKSAEFLAELRDRFGNLGLAAAAYNAGPQRVRDWMAGTRTLPGETRRYVLAITGTPADEWARGAKGEPNTPGRPDCRQLMAMLKRAPNPFVEKLQERINLVAASPWGIQLSAGFSRDRALASYAAMAKRYAGVLTGRDPSILSGILRSRGTRPFYQVRIGAETRTEADKLCNDIKRAGGACLVLRNRGG
ncbi:MAG: lytic transglycosylase domain-containing protein [Xanthobacteraceae bacterium]